MTNEKPSFQAFRLSPSIFRPSYSALRLSSIFCPVIIPPPMANSHSLETFISVDVETAGPNPGQYSLLAIGACTLDEPQQTFYVELQPVNGNLTPESYVVHGLSLEALAERGLPPAEAMASFEAWLDEVVPPRAKAVCVAFNAPFDWMFLNDYFHRFLGRNPFGHTALDVKAYFMGLVGSSWAETSMTHIARRYLGNRPLTHNALQDAIDQAEIFRMILAESDGE